MEQMRGFEEDNRVMLDNQMQMKLADMEGIDLGEFIELHAQKFRDVVDSNPNLLNEYKNNPEEALQKAKDQLFH